MIMEVGGQTGLQPGAAKGEGQQKISPRSNSAIKVAEQSSSLLGEEEQEVGNDEPQTDCSTLTRAKSDINKALQGINRGIFGITSEKKSEIEDLVKALEFLNPNPHPTVDLDKLGGCWKLIYSTITILGSKRTKLGLRDFISLGDFFQVIDVPKDDG